MSFQTELASQEKSSCARKQIESPAKKKMFAYHKAKERFYGRMETSTRVNFMKVFLMVKVSRRSLKTSVSYQGLPLMAMLKVKVDS